MTTLNSIFARCFVSVPGHRDLIEEDKINRHLCLIPYNGITKFVIRLLDKKMKKENFELVIGM